MSKFAMKSVVLIFFCMLPFSAPSQEEQSDIKIKLEKLSGILGHTHAIHVTCNGRSDQYWRNHMYDLLDLEAAEEGKERDALIEAFNTGFEDEQNISQLCDNKARARFTNFANQGQKLSEALNTQISNPSKD